MGRRTAAKEARKTKSKWARKEEEAHCGRGEADRVVVVRHLKSNRVCRGREAVGRTPPGRTRHGDYKGLKEDGILGK